jgi:putative transposase
VALDAAKGQRTLDELSNEYSIHPNQISQWKRQLLESGADVFSRNSDKAAQAENVEQSELYEQIGRLKMELEGLKKSCSFRLRPNGGWSTQVKAKSACASSASC